jgi:FMN-dependent NADH-azoreductase
MAHLLHLDSSLRTTGSRSRALTARFAERWQQANPDGTVTYRDLTADPLPHLDETTFLANVTAPADRTPAQQDARALTELVAGEVIAADTIVVGMPLYNFGPPTTFKAWLDRIVVPDLTIGALADTRVVVVTARGGGYGAGTPRHGWDHREPWLRHALTTLGIHDPAFVDAELTLARESPAMAHLDLGGAEDASYAAAEAAIDALLPLPVG